jgi:predicted nucleotidyltransferase
MGFILDIVSRTIRISPSVYRVQNMRDQIESALESLEKEYDIRILYACESGSRAWGFASSDSDYDVRFIYAHSPDWYLSIDVSRDVVERMLPGDLDVSGWELRKALRLFRKSNPPLLEWMSSPIVYRQDETFLSNLRELMGTYYSPSSCFRHYLHMAEGNIRGYLTDEVVRTKKYLYVLRPMLGCRWIEQGRGPVPMEFEKLYVTLYDTEVVLAIQRLVDRKRAGAELESESADPVLAGFIEAEIVRLEGLPYRREPAAPVDELNALFRDTVRG